eukprot:Rmarinus@m.16143
MRHVLRFSRTTAHVALGCLCMSQLTPTSFRRKSEYSLLVLQTSWILFLSSFGLAVGTLTSRATCGPASGRPLRRASMSSRKTFPRTPIQPKSRVFDIYLFTMCSDLSLI